MTDDFNKKVVSVFAKKDLLKSIFSEEHYLIKKELADCKSVLDLGCGHNSPIRYCTNLKYSVGVDICKRAIEISKKSKVHTKYLNKKIESINFKPRSFDAVILIGVLEHLKKEEGRDAISKAVSWSKRKVVISVPNGFIPQGKFDDNNKYQIHLSSWNTNELKNLGFRVRGITGAKFMYRKGEFKGTSKYNLENLRFKPKPLAFVLNCLFQIPIYFLPYCAQTLFAIKNTNQ